MFRLSISVSFKLFYSTDKCSSMMQSQIIRYENDYKDFFFLQHVKVSSLKGIENVKEQKKEIERQEITKEKIIILLEILE